MGCSKQKKCHKPGPVTRNAFFNFLRELRIKGCSTSVVETARCGAKLWKKMDSAEKRKYMKGVSSAGARGCDKRRPPKKRCGRNLKRRRAIKKKLSKATCGKRQRRRGDKKSPKKGQRNRCMKPGPITSNAYLNYLRYFKKRNCGLKPREMVRKAARCWCRLPPKKKLVFRKMACKVTKSRRRLRTKLCRSVNKGKRC